MIDFNKVEQIIEGIELLVDELKYALKEYLPLRFNQLKAIRDKTQKRETTKSTKELQK